MTLTDRLAALASRSNEPRIARDLEAIAHQLARAERKIIDARKRGVPVPTPESAR